MNKNNIELQVCSPNGGRIKEYELDGQTFVEGKAGEEFIVKVKNHTGRRAAVSISIDGRNAISGDSAQNSDEAYVVPAFGSIDVKGFRISDSEVAGFVFVDGKNSYASHKEMEENKITEGDASKNNGVIGIRVTWEESSPNEYNGLTWPQKPFSNPNPWQIPTHPTWPGGPYHPIPTWSYDQIYCGTKSSTISFNCSSQPTPNMPIFRSIEQEKSNFDLGTGFGETKKDRVTTVSFKKSAETFTMELYYSSRLNLIDMGIDLFPKKQVVMPSAFGEKKYCTPPKNWKSKNS